jgi:hypothetical protein
MKASLDLKAEMQKCAGRLSRTQCGTDEMQGLCFVLFYQIKLDVLKSGAESKRSQSPERSGATQARWHS